MMKGDGFSRFAPLLDCRFHDRVEALCRGRLLQTHDVFFLLGWSNFRALTKTVNIDIDVEHDLRLQRQPCPRTRMQYRVELVPIDVDGRIRVPSHFRHYRGTFRGRYVIPRVKGRVVMLVPEATWTSLIKDVTTGAKTAIAAHRVKRTLAPLATIVIDRYGRFELPITIRRRAALQGKVVLTQTASSLEIKPEIEFERELEATREMNADAEKLAELDIKFPSTQLPTRALPEPPPGHPIFETPAEKICLLTAEELQLFARECFWRMGFLCTAIGTTFAADGGIDLLAYSPPSHPFPWILAVQVAMRRGKVGPSKPREFAGAIRSLPVNVGVLITNSTFSSQARWYAQQFNEKHSQKLWLRDIEDLKCWRHGDFQARHYSDDLGFALELYRGGSFAIEKGVMARRW